MNNPQILWTVFLGLILTLTSTLNGNPEKNLSSRFQTLPERVEIEYQSEPIADFPTGAKQFEKFRKYHTPVRSRLVKEGDKFRIDVYDNTEDETPTNSFCFDGETYHHLQRKSKILTVTTDENLIRDDLESCLYMSPFTYFDLFDLVDVEADLFPEKIRKLGEKGSITFAGSPPLPGSDPQWFNITWKNSGDKPILKQIPDELVVKFFVSKDRIEIDKFDPVNSRKITIRSASVPEEAFTNDLFILPLSLANSLIDRDAGGDLQDLK